MSNKVYIKRINKELPMPKYETMGSVGIDLYCRESDIIDPKQWALLPLNIVAVSEGQNFIAILPRSSTFRKTGLLLANSMGVVDKDYCGGDDEIMAFVYNTTDEIVEINSGDRLFQALILNVEQCEIVEVEKAPSFNSRGGFGSTD